ncbi:phosphotransferase [Allonocardiopsis opalescens]|uniref:Phosphotransferase family enzyme n=1 Tax=Allonocardiopsis opalescens TaxID=1144618 RepID=A0A2T0QE36_9ACTN|nr:phosphotransferase [Allonocardiopsis opalescens]PRY02204.1 phosphotransferase family enzyme [Allonocardiopsis opalescens]
MTEQPLAGGGANVGADAVVRSGAMVRRPVGPWTPTVHRLLDHLTAVGFAGAPGVHGYDAAGREVLDFVPGEVVHYPVPEELRGDDTVRAVARLLREYHDATVSFTVPPDAVWQLPPREPAEVICHGDAAGYNTVFRDGRPVAFIDFDVAHPGPRVWDVAYTAYRFAPLHAPGADEGWLPVPEAARRLRVFADAYGLSAADRAALPATVPERLHALVDFMHERAAAGSAAFASHIAEGHDQRYRADAAHVAAHADVLGAALMTGRT